MTWKPLLPLVGLVLGLMTVEGQILGIDLGSEFMKVALVRPGQPFQVITNIHSKRKTPMRLGFYKGERLFGADAVGLSTRRPGLVFTAPHMLLGRNSSHPDVAEYVESYAPFELWTDDRGSVGLTLPAGPETSEDPTLYSAEELTGMLLKYARKFASIFADGAVVRDAVLTVPSYFTQNERLALLDAAELADLRVLALVDENTAAAVQFGLDKVYSNETFTVLYYNLGSEALQASVVRYSSYDVKKGGKNKTVGMGHVLSKGWNKGVGGLHFDRILVNYLADTYNEKHGPGSKQNLADIRTQPRAMAKLAKTASKVKEVLSANEGFPCMVEGLTPEVDFRHHVKRADFIELIQPLLDQAVTLVDTVLEDAGLVTEDLDEVELIGGSVRVPALQTMLTERVGRKLGQHLNGDEAMALGAAFVAANRSTAFRVRPVGMTDTNPFAIGVRLRELPQEVLEQEEVAVEDEEPKKPWSKRSTLFKPYNNMNSVKKITFKHDQDFVAHLQYEASAPLPEGTDRRLASYNITGLANFTASKADLGLGTPKVHLSFHLDQYGLASLVKAEAVLEEIVKVPITPTPSPTPSPAVEGAEEAAEGNATEPAGEAATEEATADEAAADATPAPEADETTSDETAPEGDVEASEASSSSDDAAGSEDGGDAEARRVAEEEQASTDAATAEGDDAADAGDADAATTESPEPTPTPSFKTKKKYHRKKLRVSVDQSALQVLPFNATQLKTASRVLVDLDKADEERAAREHAKNAFEAYIYDARDRMSSAYEEVEGVSTEEQREEVSATLESAEDWLYEEGESTSVEVYEAKREEISKGVEAIMFRVSEAAKREKVLSTTRTALTNAATVVEEWIEDKPQITEEERQGVLDEVQSVSAWLDEQEAAQDEQPKHEDPVFTVADVAGKMKVLKRMMDKLARKPKPTPTPTPVVDDMDEDVVLGEDTASAEAEEGAEGEGSGMEQGTEAESEDEVAEEGAEEGTARESREEAAPEGEDEAGAGEADAEEAGAEDAHAESDKEEL